MGKYEPLGEFLRAQRLREVPMTFEDIEQIIGTALPPKAQHHRAWWSNNPSNNMMTRVWLAAGYETARVDMAGRRLVFRRVSEPGAEGGTPLHDKAAPLHHPLRGLLKDVTRIAPGTDLTEPADPEWADLLDEKYGPEVQQPD